MNCAAISHRNAVHTAKPGVAAPSGAPRVTCARIPDRSSQQRMHHRGRPPRPKPAAAPIRQGRSDPISWERTMRAFRKAVNRNRLIHSLSLLAVHSAHALQHITDTCFAQPSRDFCQGDESTVHQRVDLSLRQTGLARDGCGPYGGQWIRLWQPGETES
jgi:hypothetical protein